jgi:hypothetical protein
MKYTKYRAKDDGWSIWVHPIRGGEEQAKEFYKFCCCDCGLVHDIDFREHPAGFMFRVRRNRRATGQVRRHDRRAKL